MAVKFDLQKDIDGQILFNQKATSGQVILSSKLYKTKSSAENDIELVRKRFAREGVIEERINSKGEPYFILKATNGQEIGRSEYYSSISAMEKGVASLKKNAQETKIKSTK